MLRFLTAGSVLDIGPKTIAQYQQIISIVSNRAVEWTEGGLFEDERFAAGHQSNRQRDGQFKRHHRGGRRRECRSGRTVWASQQADPRLNRRWGVLEYLEGKPFHSLQVIDDLA